MTINLYNIEGLSREDTLYFSAGSANKEVFFNSWIVAQLDSMFYPPYYENTINIELTSTLLLTTEFNYLSFEYADRTYYYFIDSISRLSDNLIALNIVMDTIMTYFDDIRIYNGFIERQFINRYNTDGTINRDYIRENFGNNDFRQVKWEYLDNRQCYLMVNVSSNGNVNNLNDTGMLGYRETTNSASYTTQYFGNLTSIYLAPMNLHYGKESLYYKDSNDSSSTNVDYKPYATFNKWSVNPETNSMFVIPLLGIGGITPAESDYPNIFNYAGNMYDFVNESANVRYLKLKAIDQTGTSYCQFVTIFSYRYLEDIPTSTHAFQSNYVPALYDDNYMHIYFGEKSNMATYPLYEATNNTLYCRVFASIYDGTRIYGITEDTYDSQFPKGSYVIQSKAELITTWSDSYTNWQANNRATIAMGVVNYLASYFTGVQQLTTNREVIGQQGINAITSASRSMKKGTKLRNRIQDIQDDTLLKQYANQQEYKTNGTGGVSSLISIATSQLNAFFAPDSIKSMGTFFTDYVSGACRIMFTISQVSNFDYCAQVYHRIGYLVNKQITSRNTQISSCFGSNRSYYQFVKLSGCYIAIRNAINSSDILNDIKDRLESGLRLWKVFGTSTNAYIGADYIGNYANDNREIG